MPAGLCRSALFGEVGDCRKGRRIINRKRSENLAVKRNVRLTETVHQLVIVQTIEACGSVNTGNPQPTKHSFTCLTITVSVDQTAFDRLTCLPILSAASSSESFCQLQNLFPSST